MVDQSTGQVTLIDFGCTHDVWYTAAKGTLEQSHVFTLQFMGTKGCVCPGKW